MAKHDSGLGAIIIVQETFLEAALAIRSPIGLLGIVLLQHVIPLHLHGDNEVGSRIGIGLPGLAKFDVARHVGQITIGLKVIQSIWNANFRD